MNLLKNHPLFKNKSLIFLLSARSLNAFASQMLTICVGWQMYTITQSAFYLGLVGLVQFVPMFLLTLVVGYVADNFNRKLIIFISLITESVVIFNLALASYHGNVTKEGILIAMFIIGTSNSFQGPPMTSILPNIVSKELFPRAAAMSAGAFQFAVIIGPALGGILYMLGAYIVYFIVGFLVIISSVLVLFISLKHKKSKFEPVTRKSVFLGISFIKSRPIILGAISLDLFAVLFGGATSLLPVYASKILFIGSFGLGLLRSAPAVGALLMSTILARKPLSRNVGKTMFLAVVVFGLATIVFAVSKSFILSMVALFFLGSADVISMVIRSTLVQIATPDNMRGRVNSVNQLFIGTSNQLGEFESGITAGIVGVVPAVLVGGIGTIIVVIVWMRLFPELANIDSMRNYED